MALQAFQERVQQAEAGYALESKGLRVLRELSVTEWRALGYLIASGHDARQWQLGDWLVYGMGLKLKPGPGISTDIYDLAVEVTGLARKSLYNAARVATAFPIHRRLGTSYRVHARIASLPEDQRQLVLQRAVKDRWTEDDVLEEIDRRIARHGPRTVMSSSRLTPRMGVQCPKCGYVLSPSEIKKGKVKRGLNGPPPLVRNGSNRSR